MPNARFLETVIIAFAVCIVSLAERGQVFASLAGC
jgi:hypothetical protein